MGKKRNEHTRMWMKWMMTMGDSSEGPYEINIIYGQREQ